MLKYILKRIGFSALALIILLLLVFFLIQAVPGYPIVRANNDTDASYLAKVGAAGLLDNVFVQLGRFISDFFKTGAFGQVYTSTETVYETMLEPIKYTLLIALPAFVISSIVGILFGILSAYYRGRWPDILINGISVLFVSVPSFIFALYLIQLAGAIGLPTQFVLPDADTPTSEMIKSMIIPILAMVLSSVSVITYYTRNELVEVFKQDYIKVALAKGYSFRQVVWKYALRNGSIPIVAVLLPSFLTILTGSIIIEKFFNVPGTALELLNGINTKEIYIVVFAAVFYGAIYFILQIIADVLFTIIDPRIVLAEKKANSFYKQFKAAQTRQKRLDLIFYKTNFLQYFVKNNAEITSEEDVEFSTGAIVSKAEVETEVVSQALNYNKIQIHNTRESIPDVDQKMFASVDIYNISSEEIAGKPTKYLTDVVKRFFKSKSALFFTVVLGIILFIGIIISLSSLNTVTESVSDLIPSSIIAYLPPRIPWLGIDGITDITISASDFKALLPFEHLGLWTTAKVAGTDIVATAASTGSIDITGFNPYVLPGMNDTTLFLGTDGLGRNWSNMLWYSTIRSFSFAVIVAIPSVVLGTIYGSIAGSNAGKAADTVMMRIVEILGAVPLILWIMILGLIFSGGTLDLLTIGVALILVNWMWPAVTARTYILKYKDAEFVQAAQTLGASRTRIIFSHMLPNIAGRLFVRFVNMIPSIIFFEASLVLLGLKSSDDISLGSMIETSRVNQYPHLLFGPTIMMILLTLSSQIIANNLNDSLDPRVSGE